MGSRGMKLMMEYSQITPAHFQPIPLMWANVQFAYTDSNVATCNSGWQQPFAVDQAYSAAGWQWESMSSMRHTDSTEWYLRVVLRQRHTLEGIPVVPWSTSPQIEWRKSELDWWCWLADIWLPWARHDFCAASAHRTRSACMVRIQYSHSAQGRNLETWALLTLPTFRSKHFEENVVRGRGCILTSKKWVSLAAQKKSTVIIARYMPMTTPWAKISFSFQLSGRGDGFTRSLEIVMIVPEYNSVRVFLRFPYHHNPLCSAQTVQGFRIKSMPCWSIVVW